MRKITDEIFIEKVNKIHKNKYDYSLVKYKNNRTKVKIICPIHGLFTQIAGNHLSGYGCKICAVENSKEILTTHIDIFIKKANKIHKNKYDYSLVKYKNNRTKVKIICPIHGEFTQTPGNHLMKTGCKKCSIKNSKKMLSFSTKEFIEKANKIHKNKYDYSLVKYKNMKVKVKIICPIHGIFEQIPEKHLNEHECNYCGNMKIRLKAIERIEKNKLNGHQLVPNYNPNACEIFDKISKEKNIHIQHAQNGGEYHLKELGYWVDGYDEVNNTVYEFDEKYHESEKQQKKDLIRQNEITSYLGCDFIRFKN